MKVCVVGAGSWGTALAQMAAAGGHNVSLWARRSEVVQGINKNHENPSYLKGYVLSPFIVASTSLEDCVAGSQAIIVATPSSLLRGSARALASHASNDTPIIICSKGVEADSGFMPTEVFEQEMGNPDRLVVLSGPNHAEEVAMGVPTGTVVASTSQDAADFVQELVSSQDFRAYTSDDTVGVQLCAAAKNVIAIAVGMSVALGYGDNTSAMLMTRGLAEMSRLVKAMGGQALTCMGLAGMGDLVVTCTSRHSRNRRFGEMVAQGKTLDDFADETHMVAEGAYACRSLKPLAEHAGIEMPITQVVREVVWEGADVREAANALAMRSLKEEFYGLD